MAVLDVLNNEHERLIRLRTTSLYVSDNVHSVARLALAVVTGGLLTAVILQVCENYRVFELGFGLLLSLSPAGIYDLFKWWFRRGRSPIVSLPEML